MFRINGTVHPQVGQEVSIQCRLSAGNEIEKDRCEFEAPNGHTFFTNPDNGRVDVFRLNISDRYHNTDSTFQNTEEVAECDH